MTSQQQLAHSWNSEHPAGSPVLARPGTLDQEPLVTRTRTAAWVLASGEAVVSVVGCAGGISLAHVTPDPTRQPAVPDIEFEMPPCPICGHDLEHDGDSFGCNGCYASWNSSGQGGGWDNPSATRCPATCHPLPSAMPSLVEQCVLALDHGGLDGHRTLDGLSCWDDASANAVLDSDGEPVR